MPLAIKDKQNYYADNSFWLRRSLIKTDSGYARSRSNRHAHTDSPAAMTPSADMIR
jgi:hypothetical protein